MMAELDLIVTAGKRAGARISVAEQLVLGRETGGNGSLDDDEKVSRRHALIRRDLNGDWIIEDAGSVNGTFVNGVHVKHRQRLQPGDTIRVGETTLRVGTGDEPPSAEAEANESVDPPTRPSEQIGAPARTAEPPAPFLAPLAVLVRAGRRVPISQRGLTIGRAPENDVVVDSDRSSRHHARIVAAEGRYFLADLGSVNGSELNGERLVKQARWLRAGDTIAIGAEQFRFLIGGDETLAGVEAPLSDGIRRIRFDRSKLSIGRDSANDLQLDSPGVSRFHAEVVNAAGRIELRDLESRNGTRLDGLPVSRAEIKTGSEIGVGPYRLIFDGTTFIERDDRGVVRLQAYEIAVSSRGKQLLEATSVAVKPGEFVAVIGESGSGKTTLIKVLAGVRRSSAGGVFVNGDPVWTRLAEIGYLPQDEIVHPRLTVLESLRYSARLRLPADHSPQDIDAAVGRVVSETSLEEHVNTRIGSLSGGERKRVGLATELLTRPALLFLDEPTTGLDPRLETRMMRLFRDLAAVGRSALVMATHTTKNLDLVDKIWVVGRGGYLCFVGSPVHAKSFFGVSEYDDIYAALESKSATAWRHQFLADEAQAGRTPGGSPVPSPTPAGTKVRGNRFSSQAPVLLSRYLRTFVRDQRNVLILLLQVPLLAIVMALLFKPHVFSAPGSTSDSSSTALLLFVLVTTTIWLGTLDSAREVIKERAILARERAVGLDVRAYLASKAALLFALIALQTLILLLVVLALRPMQEPAATKLLLMIELVTTGFVAVAMGLVISSAVKSEDQAIAVIPIAMIVQLLFGGAIVTVKDMGAAMSGFSTVVFARSAFAGVGTAAHMNDRIHADARFNAPNPYGYSYFDLPGWATLLILGAFLFSMLLVSATILQRHEVG
jgi:ABC transport system ATP-binding/permease protein